MSEPLALQKVEELRSVVGEDSDVAELVDTLATLLVLKQDVTEPMLGAKVMFYEKPEGEWVDISWDYYRELHPNGDDLPDDPEDVYYENERTGRMTQGSDGPKMDTPWWLNWRRIDGDRNKTIPDGTVEHRFTRYYSKGEKRKVERDEVPDPLDEDNSLEEDCSHAREMEEVGISSDPRSEWFGEWMVYEKDFREYRFTPWEPVEDFVARRALVIDASIAEQPSDTEFWDPNREEYTTPDDYPMGTVNVVLADSQDKEFGEDYVYETRVETSVTPADGGTNGHVYTPGWE